jgi:lysozyme
VKISPAGIAAIKRHEGLRLHAYQDSAGVWTIGHGHTGNVQPGQHISEAEAEQLLRDDLAQAEAAVNNGVRVPVTQEQYDAMVSLAFNIGGSAFGKSTLLQKLNEGDIHAAANEFLRWDKITVNGAKEVLPGLTSRRRAERAMFLTTPAQPGDPTQYSQEAGMPIPALVTALLPSVVAAIPRLAAIFKNGSEVAERNVAAASAVLDIVTQATGSVNAQAAVEKLQTDPAAVAAATKAVESNWFTLAPADGGGIAGARQADAAMSGNDMIHSPSFWVAIALLPLVYMIVGSVVGLFGTPWSEDVRSAIANGVVGMVIGALAGYYFGQTTSRNRTPAP